MSLSASWINLPTDLLRAVGKIVGLKWEEEVARPLVTNLSNIVVWRRFGEYVQEIERARPGLTPTDVAWNEVPRDFGPNTIAQIFLSIFYEKFRQDHPGGSLSGQGICQHMASCKTCQIGLLMGMDDLMVCLAIDPRGRYYFHMIPGTVVCKIILPLDPESYSREEENAADGFHHICEEDPGMQNLFRQWGGEGSGDLPLA